MLDILNNCQLFFDILMKKKNRPVKTYITLKRMQSVTAQAIFDCLHDVLILMGKDWHSIFSVCFDGASTMAGKIGGVQTKCKEQNLNIKYIHCYAHCLNLALVDSVCDKSKNSKRNKLVFNFFRTIQFTYNFIESSAMRLAILEKISKNVGIKLLTLKSCSITRWACRAEAVKSVLNNYEVLLLAIEEICESSVLEMCAKGMGLKYQLKSFDFIFGLYLLNPILNIILKTSSLLQSPNMDLVLAVNSVQSLVQNLMAMRNSDEEFRNIYQQSVELCHKNGVQVPEAWFLSNEGINIDLPEYTLKEINKECVTVNVDIEDFITFDNKLETHKNLQFGVFFRRGKISRKQ
ncbi:hypothetical protein QTP88_025300 [Uroleucon formosanum]